jgi:hypothetical protein
MGEASVAMDKNTGWKAFFALMAFMAGISLRKPDGDAVTLFRLAVVLGGVVGYIVVSKKKPAPEQPNAGEGQLSVSDKPIASGKANVPIGRLLLVVAILIAAAVGVLVLARLTSLE